MAKSNVALKEDNFLEENQALTNVVQIGNLQLHQDLMDDIQADAGRGVSQRAEDNITPMVGILQALSPACSAKHASYIPGAEPGAFLLKNSPVEVIPGHVGFPFIPSALELAWVEWVPRKRGGGFVGKHQEKPANARQVVDPENDKVKWILPDSKNEIIETRYRYGLIDLSEHGFGPLPFVLPFTSSGHTICRTWETLMNSLLIPGTSKPLPAWAAVYRIKTKQKTNAQGQVWFVADISLERSATKSEYLKAKALHEAWAAGQQSVDAAQSADLHDDVVFEETPF